jgi:hypothetical protein
MEEAAAAAARLGLLAGDFDLAGDSGAYRVSDAQTRTQEYKDEMEEAAEAAARLGAQV